MSLSVHVVVAWERRRGDMHCCRRPAGLRRRAAGKPLAFAGKPSGGSARPTTARVRSGCPAVWPSSRGDTAGTRGTARRAAACITHLPGGSNGLYSPSAIVAARALSSFAVAANPSAAAASPTGAAVTATSTPATSTPAATPLRTVSGSAGAR